MSIKHKSHRVSSKVPPPSGRKPSLRLTAREADSLLDDLRAYHRRLAASFQRREQRQWSLFYLCGQLSNLKRKTIEPMILELKGLDANAVRALDQFMGAGRWDARRLVHGHQAMVAESLGDPEAVVIVDGSGFPKEGHASVGVERQYCGRLGKVANCQEGVFLVYASPLGYTFLDSRLYLPKTWFEDAAAERWKACGIPDKVTFQTEPELALAMVQELVTRGVVPFRWVTADEHFGQNPAFLQGIADLGKCYFAEVPSDTRAWLRMPAIEWPGPGPLGRPRTKARVALHAPRPREVRELARQLPRHAWTRYFIKEGSKGPMRAEFAFLRVISVRDELPGPRVWLIIRRSLGTPTEMKFYFSNASRKIAPRELAQLSGWRWPIETTLEEGKGEIGLDQYELRTWPGWQHHMVQSFVAHHFLIKVRLKFKKSSSDDDRSSPRVDGQCPSGRRRPFGRHLGSSGIPATTELCRLSFASQDDAKTLS